MSHFLPLHPVVLLLYGPKSVSAADAVEFVIGEIASGSYEKTVFMILHGPGTENQGRRERAKYANAPAPPKKERPIKRESPKILSKSGEIFLEGGKKASTNWAEEEGKSYAKGKMSGREEAFSKRALDQW